MARPIVDSRCIVRYIALGKISQGGDELNIERSKSSWVPTNPLYDPNKPLQVGGQAVIEGVMMRAPRAVATAVRRANGDIVVRKEDFVSIVERFPFLKLPVLRGSIGLIDMLYLGIKTLNYSAEIAMLDIEAEEAAKSGDGQARKKSKGASTAAMIGTLIVAVGLGIAIFFVLPIMITTKVFHFEQDAFAFNLIAGLIRIAILLGYLVAISAMKDIKRLFAFHGAEHKAVFTFELNKELLPSVARQQSRFHPRCGTSFLLIVMFVAILSFSLLDAILIGLLGKLTMGIRLVTHLPFIPIVGGLSYEIIKFSAKHSARTWGAILVAPGLWLQRITTREPDDSQIEVAVVALRCALGLEDASKYCVKEPLEAEKVTAIADN